MSGWEPLLSHSRALDLGDLGAWRQAWGDLARAVASSRPPRRARGGGAKMRSPVQARRAWRSSGGSANGVTAWPRQRPVDASWLTPLAWQRGRDGSRAGLACRCLGCRDVAAGPCCGCPLGFAIFAVGAWGGGDLRAARAAMALTSNQHQPNGTVALGRAWRARVRMDGMRVGVRNNSKLSGYKRHCRMQPSKVKGPM